MRTFVAGGRAHARHTDSTIDHRNLVTAYLHQANTTGRITGPVHVWLTFCFARPASHYGTGRNAGKLKPSAPPFHTKAPDVDKLARLVLDAMENAGIVANDAQVIQLQAGKAWVADDPGTLVGWRAAS